MGRFLVCMVVAAFGVAGCDDDGTGVQEERFEATLTGGAEVPPVTTDGSGSATFVWDGTTMAFSLEVEDMNQVTASHIHSGATGTNGPVVVTLFAGPTTGEFSGTLAEASFTAPDEGTITMTELINGLRTGAMYVNVHTLSHPAGEIRGQIAAQ